MCGKDGPRGPGLPTQSKKRFIYLFIYFSRLASSYSKNLKDPKPTVIRQAITDEQTPATIQPIR